MTVAELLRGTTSALAEVLVPRAEAEAAARIILEDTAGYDRKYIFMYGNREVLPETAARVGAVAQRVVDGEPVQYAVGTARFMGNTYTVTPAVLIPRPETAGLVDLITDAWGGRRDLRILDIGTGSGCIAISLALALPYADVSAVDISAEALEVARENARSLHAAVTFRRLDILRAEPPQAPSLDIVVSNPPYIARSEAADMDARVLDHEPGGALFVPDSDPLVFYRAIARYAATALRPGGALYFEINARYPEQMRRLLEEEGYTSVDILRDYRGAYRYATCRRP